MKAVQKFSKEYLQESRKMSPDSIIRFLEDFRILHGNRQSKSVLISLKVPEALLKSFRAKSEAAGTRYQTQIKKLMEKWLLS